MYDLEGCDRHDAGARQHTNGFQAGLTHWEPERTVSTDGHKKGRVQVECRWFCVWSYMANGGATKHSTQVASARLLFEQMRRCTHPVGPIAAATHKQQTFTPEKSTMQVHESTPMACRQAYPAGNLSGRPARLAMRPPPLFNPHSVEPTKNGVLPQVHPPWVLLAYPPVCIGYHHLADLQSSQ